MIISNAFSLQMLDMSKPQSIRTTPISLDEVREIGSLESAVGHVDTAAVLSGMIGKDIPANRISISLDKGDELVVAQLTGGRLPEGSTKLPEGFKLTFVKVTVE